MGRLQMVPTSRFVVEGGAQKPEFMALVPRHSAQRHSA